MGTVSVLIASWRSMPFRRRLLALAALACLLRMSAACLTHWHPIFPDYYYTDARFTDSDAWRLAESWRRGLPMETLLSAGSMNHAYALAGFYSLFGHQLLLAKLLHALAGAAAVLLLGLAARRAFDDRCSLALCAAVAVWPSHIFFTSQIFKDPFVMLLAYGTMSSLLEYLDGPEEGGGARHLACAAAGLALAGLLRTYVMLVLAASLCAGALRLVRSDARGRRRAAVALAALLVTLACGVSLNRAVKRTLIDPKYFEHEDMSIMTSIVPSVQVATDSGHVFLVGPRALSTMRQAMRESDSRWARTYMGREVSTYLFPDARLETWADLLRFVPKAAFYALYMPLPGLYPMDGKLGRVLAGCENLALLVLSALALRGLFRRGWSPGAVAFLCAFAMMGLGSSLLEFDLGSAARHKVFYLPFFLAFAARPDDERR